MIFTDLIPFAEAITSRRIKSVLPTDLSSAELSRLSTELKERATFSARTTNAGYLQELNDLITEISGGATPEGQARREAGEGPLLQDIPGARVKLRDYLQKIGYRPDPDERGSIKDLSSDRRLNLVIDTNVDMAQGYGQWKQGQDPTTLDEWPALELIRVIDAEQPRDWPERFARAGVASGRDDGWGIFGGRMIALKNHPLWEELGSPDLFDDGLGNPYPPFAFSSGMDVRDIPRDEAVALGLIDEDRQVPPGDRGFNDGLETSAEQFSEELRRVLADDPDLQLIDGVLKLAA